MISRIVTASTVRVSKALSKPKSHEILLIL